VAKKPLFIGSIALLLFGLIAPSSLARATTPPKIAVLYDLGGRGDHSINDSAAIGVDAAKKKFAIDPLDIREMVSDGSELDRLHRLRFLVQANYSLIIAVGSAYEKAVRIVSTENPTVQFAILDDAAIPSLSVQSMNFDSQQSAFLAGVIAASASKVGKVGFIQQSAAPRDIAAFTRGVKFVNPKAAIFTELPLEPNPDNEMDQLYTDGIDVLYSTWESTNDVVTSLDSLNRPSHTVKLIGVLPDQYFLQSPPAKKILIATINKAFNKAAYDAIASGLSGITYSEVFGDAVAFGHDYTLANQGIGATLTALGAKSANSVKALSAAKSALLSGRVKFQP